VSERTLEQRRAVHALEQVQALKVEKGNGNFTSYVDALPAVILNNGLGQAMATELAGKDEGHKKLYKVMEAWLCGDDKSAPYRGKANDPGLIRAIAEGFEKNYLLAQPEALAYLVWLKKFARAFLEPSKGQDA
jgi:CRISPR-associated protein Cmr5